MTRIPVRFEGLVLRVRIRVEGINLNQYSILQLIQNIGQKKLSKLFLAVMKIFKKDKVLIILESSVPLSLIFSIIMKHR